jgi:phosphohistidine phosphatase SixA
MNRLFLVRHGAYTPGQNFLNERGRKQTEQITKDLSSQVDKQAVVVLSSTGPRSIETAQKIAAELGTIVEQNAALIAQGHSGESFERAFLILRNQKTNDVVLVTNGKFISGFPDFVCRRLMNREFGTIPIEKGVAAIVCVDLPTKSITKKEYA